MTESEVLPYKPWVELDPEYKGCNAIYEERTKKERLQLQAYIKQNPTCLRPRTDIDTRTIIEVFNTRHSFPRYRWYENTFVDCKKEAYRRILQKYVDGINKNNDIATEAARGKMNQDLEKHKQIVLDSLERTLSPKISLEGAYPPKISLTTTLPPKIRLEAAPPSKLSLEDALEKRNARENAELFQKQTTTGSAVETDQRPRSALDYFPSIQLMTPSLRAKIKERARLSEQAECKKRPRDSDEYEMQRAAKTVKTGLPPAQVDLTQENVGKYTEKCIVAMFMAFTGSTLYFFDADKRRDALINWCNDTDVNLVNCTPVCMPLTKGRTIVLAPDESDLPNTSDLPPGTHILCDGGIFRNDYSTHFIISLVHENTDEEPTIKIITKSLNNVTFDLKVGKVLRTRVYDTNTVCVSFDLPDFFIVTSAYCENNQEFKKFKNETLIKYNQEIDNIYKEFRNAREERTTYDLFERYNFKNYISLENKISAHMEFWCDSNKSSRRNSCSFEDLIAMFEPEVVLIEDGNVADTQVLSAPTTTDSNAGLTTTDSNACLTTTDSNSGPTTIDSESDTGAGASATSPRLYQGPAQEMQFDPTPTGSPVPRRPDESDDQETQATWGDEETQDDGGDFQDGSVSGAAVKSYDSGNIKGTGASLFPECKPTDAVSDAEPVEEPVEEPAEKPADIEQPGATDDQVMVEEQAATEDQEMVEKPAAPIDQAVAKEQAVQWPVPDLNDAKTMRLYWRTHPAINSDALSAIEKVGTFTKKLEKIIDSWYSKDKYVANDVITNPNYPHNYVIVVKGEVNAYAFHITRVKPEFHKGKPEFNPFDETTGAFNVDKCSKYNAHGLIAPMCPRTGSVYLEGADKMTSRIAAIHDDIVRRLFLFMGVTFQLNMFSRVTDPKENVADFLYKKARCFHAEIDYGELIRNMPAHHFAVFKDVPNAAFFKMEYVVQENVSKCTGVLVPFLHPFNIWASMWYFDYTTDRWFQTHYPLVTKFMWGFLDDHKKAGFKSVVDQMDNVPVVFEESATCGVGTTEKSTCIQVTHSVEHEVEARTDVELKKTSTCPQTPMHNPALMGVMEESDDDEADDEADEEADDKPKDKATAKWERVPLDFPTPDASGAEDAGDDEGLPENHGEPGEAEDSESDDGESWASKFLRRKRRKKHSLSSDSDEDIQRREESGSESGNEDGDEDGDEDGEDEEEDDDDGPVGNVDDEDSQAEDGQAEDSQSD